MPPKDDIEANEPPKRTDISNADIVPGAGKVHLGKCSRRRRRPSVGLRLKRERSKLRWQEVESASHP